MDVSEAMKEVYQWAHTKGWEPDADRPFADACALIHSEVSEALEAYRTWKFDDPTIQRTATGNYYYLPGEPIKPEGVASELADVLIRLLHYCKAYSLALNTEFPLPEFSPAVSFGTECALMHAAISGAFVCYEVDDVGGAEIYLSRLYALLCYSCQVHDFSLWDEYRRKMDYNKTRAYRHGNRAM